MKKLLRVFIKHKGNAPLNAPLKSRPEHVVNCFTVNTFAVRHFTVSLLYFEFCPVESEEEFF